MNLREGLKPAHLRHYERVRRNAGRKHISETARDHKTRRPERTRPPLKLTEIGRWLVAQYQLQKERLSAARFSRMVNGWAALVVMAGPLVL